ncbi:hypothetical protein [Kineosporia sp. A_224]|uniref:hypothetical protein n=1 Tax=Kineosporia sp. A_224 TaxID=1962180 RepID=UPI000B4B87BB|nr:hypothetical protein [Kineosporia sp. A_224]
MGGAAVALLAASAAFAVSPASAGDDGAGLLLRSGVAGSTPPAAGGPALFTVNPGGRPWVAGSESKVVVTRDGLLVAKVRGLVIPGNAVPNPVPALAASLVCNGKDGALTVAVPFDTAGDADIRATVDVPQPCVAPVVLLHPNGAAGTYIAATG